MKLVPNWRRAWRWYSVQASIIGAALVSAWPILPAGLRADLPDGLRTIIAVVTLLAVVPGRIVKQEDDDENRP